MQLLAKHAEFADLLTELPKVIRRNDSAGVAALVLLSRQPNVDADKLIERCQELLELAKSQPLEMHPLDLVEAIANLNSHAQPLVPVLIELAKSENDQLQRTGITGLMHIGPGAQTALPTLEAITPRVPPLAVSFNPSVSITSDDPTTIANAIRQTLPSDFFSGAHLLVLPNRVVSTNHLAPHDLAKQAIRWITEPETFAKESELNRQVREELNRDSTPITGLGGGGGGFF